MAATDALLEARGLVKRFGGLVATDDLDLSVRHGEIHAVIGPNGAGKTTLIGQLTGELRPDAGSILFDGADVTALAAPARARLSARRAAVRRGRPARSRSPGPRCARRRRATWHRARG